MDTRSREYTQWLIDRERARWPVARQLPYRWNVRRLALDSVLEIGCGIGRNLRHLNGREAVGIDENESAVALACSRGLTAFVPAAFRHSEWARPGRFDTLLLAHVAEHLSLDEGCRLLGDYREFLSPGGRVVLITPQEACFRLDSTHVEFVDFKKGAELLGRAGLEVVRQTSFPFPRIFGRWFHGNEFVTVGRNPGGRTT